MEALLDRRPLPGVGSRSTWRRLNSRRTSQVRCQSQHSKQFKVSEREWQSQLQPGSRRAVQCTVAPYSTRAYRNLQESAESFSVSLTAEPQTGLTSDSPKVLRELLQRWEELPGRYKLVFATSLSFVVCNMDKVNISVAIIPMAQDFGWSPTMIGLVQSSFFWGYLLSQIPGGFVTSRLGGRKVLPAGVSLWSAATAAVPILAGTIPGLCLSRAAVGLGEGVAPSAATDMVAKSIDKAERARAVSFIFGGLHVGSLLGLLVAPPLIQTFGWESIFYLFGSIGLLWTVYWENLVRSVQQDDPELIQALEKVSNGTASEEVPWRAILRTRAFWALAFTHFCNNWFHYTFLAWLPTFYTDRLSLDLSHAAHMALLPPLCAIGVSAFAGTTADALVARGVSTSVVRKLMQCVAFLMPAACLTGASMTDDGATTVALITAGLAMSSCSLAGLYCNHADLSPRYAPFMLGMTNTAGSVPGIIGVAFTGVVLDKTDSWALALFAPSILFFLAGSAVFTVFGRTEPANFDNNEPFEFETKLPFFKQH